MDAKPTGTLQRMKVQENGFVKFGFDVSKFKMQNWTPTSSSFKFFRCGGKLQ